jgi:CubicO group peptidase (beta-lactamase class C family)
MFFIDPQIIQHIERHVDEYVQPLVDKKLFSGVLFFADKNSVLLRKGYGKANYSTDLQTTPDTKYRLCSTSKQFIALAILQLNKNEKLQLQDPVMRYLPEYVNDNRITIEHLLIHTSGIQNYTKLDTFKTKIMTEPLNMQELVDLFKNKPLDFDPSKKFAYGSSGYVLLIALIEKISNQSYSDYLKTNILNPLRMNDSCGNFQDIAVGYQMNSGVLGGISKLASETAIGVGDFYSTVDDLYKWDKAIFSEKCFEADLFKTMSTPYVQASNFFDNPQYGYGLFISSILGRKCIGHFGRLSGFHTLFLHFVEEDACLIMLSNFEHSPLEEMATQLLPFLLNPVDETIKAR